jgi:Ni,Fe-hydrogenase maturation factor
MRTHSEQLNRFSDLSESLHDMPPNEITQRIRKKISDIKDLIIKVDVACEKDKDLPHLYDRIDTVLDEVEGILKAVR